jgi:dihydrofolate reductase
MCRDNGIGYKGQLPWRITRDMEYFAQITKGDGLNAVVMGHKTWQSLPIPKGKPRGLPQRDNFILSRSNTFDMLIAHEHLAKTFKSFEEMETYLDKNDIYEEVWLIGGTDIYKHFLDAKKVQYCYITHIDADFDCDTFFPVLNSAEWKETKRTDSYDATYECKVTYSVYKHLD